MRIKIAALALAVIAVSAMAGASAFTTGSVARSASVDVVSDDAGLIALADGTSGDLVSQSSDGKLTIDFTKGGAGGVNPDASYQLGNSADPTNQTAFTISNLDAETHDLTVAYNNVDTGATGDSTDNIQFQVYNSTSSVGTVSEESTSTTITGVTSGETLYVVMDVDTSGLTNSTSLSGTLNVSA
jgi:hypothetical protein